MLFTFPSRYLSTIGHGRVFRLGGWSPLLPTGFHVSGSTQEQAHALCVGFAYGTLTLFSQPFHAVLLPQALHFIACPTTPSAVSLQAVWPHPRSLATTWGISVDFSSSGYLDVSVLRVASPKNMCSSKACQKMSSGGFAHSDICGSASMCLSPQLIAACHVLHRLSVPRHPPCALTIFFLLKTLSFNGWDITTINVFALMRSDAIIFC